MVYSPVFFLKLKWHHSIISNHPHHHPSFSLTVVSTSLALHAMLLWYLALGIPASFLAPGSFDQNIQHVRESSESPYGGLVEGHSGSLFSGGDIYSARLCNLTNIVISKGHSRWYQCYVISKGHSRWYQCYVISKGHSSGVSAMSSVRGIVGGVISKGHSRWCHCYVISKGHSRWCHCYVISKGHSRWCHCYVISKGHRWSHCYVISKGIVDGVIAMASVRA